MKNTLWMSILLALLVSGCSQEEMLKHTSSASGGRVFTTSFENDESRTYLEDGKYSRWTEGDRISLFDASTLNNQYLFAGDTGDSGGTFFMLSKPEGTGTTLATNYAVYPYDKDMTISSKGTITLTLPSIQHYAENSYGLGDNTMVAVTENTDDTFLSFKNVGGCFKLQLYGDDVTVKSITLKGNNDEKIAGKATITAAYDKAPVVTMADDAATSITLDCGKGIKMGTTEDEATTFWIVVPPTIFSKGITVMVRDFGNKVFSQSTDKELVIERNVVKPMAPVKAVMIEDNTGSSADSVYYCSDMDGFELVSATKDGQAFYMQTDATFAFKCMYDFGKTQNLVAYCDSTGMVERIVTEDKVINILYHEDLSKIDIFFEKDGKLEWLRDLENPYQEMSSRAIEGDVPYSAISVQNRLSHAVYKILNDHPLGIGEKLWGYLKKFGIPAYNSQLRMEFMVNMLSETFSKDYIENHYKTIQTVMNDYAVWVMNEMYGNAMPVVHNWVERTINDTIKIDCHVNDVDPSKTDFRIGMRIESDKIVQMPYYKHDKCDKNAPLPELVHIKCTMYATGDKNFLEYTCLPLPAGRKYKFRAFLVPSASSKYLTNMKCILDYSRWGDADEFYLFDPKATVLSEKEDEVKIQLSTEVDDYRKSFTMGVYYGTDSEILKTKKWEVEKLRNLEHQTQEVEVSSIADGIDGEISKELVLEGLKPGVTYYYKPYIQYSGNISNKPVANYLETIFPEDRIFYGVGDSITVIENPKTKEIKVNGNKATLLGYFNPETEGVVEQGFVTRQETNSRSNSELTIENGTLIKANGHQNGNFEASIDWNESIKSLYYRAYIKVKDKYYYGEVKKYVNDPLREALIKLYQSTNGDNWTYNDNWCSDKPITEWYGVRNTYYKGYEISLASNNLTGKIEQTFPDDLEIVLDVYDNRLTSINVSGCTALAYLGCENNRLNSLNVTGCTELKSLKCIDNQLTSLNVSSCTALLYLGCDNNQLTSLNVSSCTALNELDCSYNQLTSLNVSGCTTLFSLGCENNQLTSLNVSSCTALEILHCPDNQLTSLNVSNCTALVELLCYNNQLTSLNVTGCTSLGGLICHNNKINSVIPDWFSQLQAFRYDVKYNYWDDIVDGKLVKIYTDNGYGWWYPGEPEKGYHGPN